MEQECALTYLDARPRCHREGEAFWRAQHFSLIFFQLLFKNLIFSDV